MSIATLKRKTQTKYNNMSVGTHGFSLNGTRRNQGYIGQTSLSRTLVRNLRNGTELRGHGGCCSNNNTEIIQNETICMNDNDVVKKSVLSTSGMLKTRYCNNACNVVKPDNNNNINTQSDFINRKRKECINCTTTTINLGDTNYCNIAKPDEVYLVKSSGSYIQELNKACTNNDNIYIPYSVLKQPFAGFN